MNNDIKHVAINLEDGSRNEDNGIKKVRFTINEFNSDKEQQEQSKSLNVRELSSSSTQSLSKIDENVEKKVIDVADVKPRDILGDLMENMQSTYEQEEFKNKYVTTNPKKVNSMVEVSPSKTQPHYVVTTYINLTDEKIKSNKIKILNNKEITSGSHPENIDADVVPEKLESHRNLEKKQFKQFKKPKSKISLNSDKKMKKSGDIYKTVLSKVNLKPRTNSLSDKNFLSEISFKTARSKPTIRQNRFNFQTPKIQAKSVSLIQETLPVKKSKSRKSSRISTKKSVQPKQVIINKFLASSYTVQPKVNSLNFIEKNKQLYSSNPSRGNVKQSSQNLEPKSPSLQVQLIIPENLDTENISDSDDNHHSESLELRTQQSFMSIMFRRDPSDLRVEDTLSQDDLFEQHIKELELKHRMEIKRLKIEQNQNMTKITENFEETQMTQFRIRPLVNSRELSDNSGEITEHSLQRIKYVASAAGLSEKVRPKINPVPSKNNFDFANLQNEEVLDTENICDSDDEQLVNNNFASIAPKRSMFRQQYI